WQPLGPRDETRRRAGTGRHRGAGHRRDPAGDVGEALGQSLLQPGRGAHPGHAGRHRLRSRHARHRGGDDARGAGRGRSARHPLSDHGRTARRGVAPDRTAQALHAAGYRSRPAEGDRGHHRRHRRAGAAAEPSRPHHRPDPGAGPKPRPYCRSVSMSDWRKMSPQELEAHFNPRAAVPDFERHFNGWIERSQDAKAKLPGEYDLRYGPGPLQTYDLHRPASAKPGAPLVVLVHGGYWRGLDKNTMIFAVTPFLEHGAVVVNLNYDLCPKVTLDAIVRQVQEALVHI